MQELSSCLLQIYIHTIAKGKRKKCKFWQLFLWALTSWDIFCPRPHPGSDFPISALIYRQELFLFLKPKKLPSTILNKVLYRSTWEELNDLSLYHQPSSMAAHFWRCSKHKSLPGIHHCPSCSPETKKRNHFLTLFLLRSWALKSLFCGTSRQATCLTNTFLI